MAMTAVTCHITKSVVLDTVHEHGGKRRRQQFVIPDDLIADIGGEQFLLLSRHHMITRRIMSILIPDAKVRQSINEHSIKMRRASKCTGGKYVTDLLYTCMDKRMRRCIVGSDQEVEKLPHKWSQIKLRKRYRHALAQIPEVIEIQSPSIGDIQPITLSLATSTTSKVVQLHVTSESITWLAQVVAYKSTQSSNVGEDTHGEDAHDEDTQEEEDIASDESCHEETLVHVL